jgi:hypothetical protein
VKNQSLQYQPPSQPSAHSDHLSLVKTPPEEGDKASIAKLSQRIDSLEGILEHKFFHPRALKQEEQEEGQDQDASITRQLIALPSKLEAQLERGEPFHLTLSTGNERHIIISFPNSKLLLHARFTRDRINFAMASEHIVRVQEWARELH